MAIPPPFSWLPQPGLHAALQVVPLKHMQRGGCVNRRALQHRYTAGLSPLQVVWHMPSSVRWLGRQGASLHCHQPRCHVAYRRQICSCRVRQQVDSISNAQRAGLLR